MIEQWITAETIFWRCGLSLNTVWQNGDYGVIGIHVNGTHKCCIGMDSKSTT